MSNPLDVWHMEHEYFRRLLDQLQRQLDLFHAGVPLHYELVFDIISYLRGFADDVHHPREEAAFACLEKRFPEMKLDLAHLSQEHRVIARAGETLQNLLIAVLGGTIVPRAEIEVAAATYLVYYGNHIAKEEEDVLTRAATALTAQDWEAVRAVAPARNDPLFGNHPEERYRQLRRKIALEA